MWTGSGKIGKLLARKIEKGDSPAIQDQKQHLKTNRIKAYIYKSVQEIKKVIQDPTCRARLLKELFEAYPVESAGIISLADTQASAADGGMCVVPNDDSGMEADD